LKRPNREQSGLEGFGVNHSAGSEVQTKRSVDVNPTEFAAANSQEMQVRIAFGLLLLAGTLYNRAGS
jgi:hypothetical protein